MRSIETVGSRRKLITTNADVLRYDLASTGQVLVWDGDVERVRTFCAQEFRPLPDEVYERYSIESFSDALVGMSEGFSGYVF